jgi:hypothetical protein
MHRTLLWCPFVPYIVLIGNVIADRNVEDFKLLEKCVETMHSAAHLSPSVSKLYRACRIFYQIAKIYLSHRAETPINPGSKGALPRPAATVPSNDSPEPPPAPDPDIDLPDFPLSHEDWNGMLDDFDLGLGAENAREMSTFFEQYLSSSGTAGATRSEYLLPGTMP